MDDYAQALLIDAATVLSCIALLARYGDLRFSHPATPYIVFHLHTVTIRLAGLLNGADALFSRWSGMYEPVRPEEIARAALYCDLAFWSVTAVWILAKTRFPPASQRSDVMMLEPRILRPVLFASLIGGIVGLRIAAQIPGFQVYDGLSQSTDWSASSYLFILPSWFGLAVLGHIYYYGFRWFTGVLLAGYLVIMAVQGGSRYRVIVGLLLAVTIWVERRNRRWPPKSMVLGLTVAGVLFFPMKTIGTMTQNGADLSEISDAISDSVTEAAEGSAADHLFLDEFASALTLLDLQGKKYYGSIYMPLLTLMVPRAWWPDKPRLAGFVIDISTGTRPMGSGGMITTYLGESYANFGLAGIFLIPPCLAFFLARFQRWARARPYDSVLRFSYVVLSVNLIQVYRDGLQSIIVFTFVNMMPLVVIVLAHVAQLLVRKRRHVGLRIFEHQPLTQPPREAEN